MIWSECWGTESKCSFWKYIQCIRRTRTLFEPPSGHGCVSAEGCVSPAPPPSPTPSHHHQRHPAPPVLTSCSTLLWERRLQTGPPSSTYSTLGQRLWPAAACPDNREEHRCIAFLYMLSSTASSNTHWCEFDKSVFMTVILSVPLLLHLLLHRQMQQLNGGPLLPNRRAQ